MYAYDVEGVHMHQPKEKGRLTGVLCLCFVMNPFSEPVGVMPVNTAKEMKAVEALLKEHSGIQMHDRVALSSSPSLSSAVVSHCNDGTAKAPGTQEYT